MKLLTSLFAFCLLSFTSSLNAADAPAMVIKFPDYINGSKLPQVYKRELIKLILEATNTEYGAYSLEFPAMNDPGGLRQSLLMDEGTTLNVVWSSPGSETSKVKTIAIPVDILRGLLGYRMCLINTTGNVDFTKLSDVNALSSLKLGQGLGWGDIDIYAFNNIHPIIAPTFDGLMSMLAANRFGCFPLGADEINGILSDFTQKMPMLAIEPSLLMYYDFPAYFYVSAKYPLIAERFALGLKKIQASGEFDKLFTKFYKGKLNNLNLTARRFICLKSPNMPADKQCLAGGPAGMKIIKEL